MLFSSLAFSQATVLGTDAANGSYQTYDLIDLGIFRQYRFQATTGAGSGIRKWEFCQGNSGAPDYSTNWRPYSGPLTLSGYNQTIIPVAGTASALANTGFGGTGGFFPIVGSTNYYTFNITEISTPGPPTDETMAVLETSYNPVAITSVVQSPIAGSVYPENSVYVTVTTASAPAAGEYIYVRYSSSPSFTTSTLLSVTMSGTSGTVEIPCQSAGTTIYYYAYSSNRSSAAILSDVGSFGQVAHDMSTLNLNNNGGPNYSYLVNTSIGFCGNYYVPSVCYPTIASFVNAINVGSISCTVVCNVAAGHTETAPAGGINLTQTGTSSANISIIKSGVGTNPIIYANTGTVTLGGASTTVDNIFTLNGSDYIFIDGIDLIDNNTTAPATMECGYGFYKNSGTDGCQFNQIINCNITLKASNSNTGPGEFKDGSRGIFLGNVTRTAVNTFLSVSNISGANSYNSFGGNTIKNVFSGIIIRGFFDTAPYAYYDLSNDVGLGVGNIIENYGGSSANTAYGVYTIYQDGISINYNSINNTASGGVAHTNTLYGIFCSTGSGAGSPIFIGVKYNSITLTQGINGNNVTAIRTGSASHNASAVEISNNIIQNCNYITGATGVFYGIDQELNCSSSVVISTNQIINNTINSTSGSPSYLIYNNNNSNDISIEFNTLTNNYKTGTGAGTLNGYFNQSGTTVGSTEIIYGNTINGLGVLSTSNASAVGIRAISGTNLYKNIENNTISNIVGGTGTSFWTAGIIADGMTSGQVASNTINSISSAANVVGINCASQASLSTSSSQSFSIADNTVNTVSSTGATATVVGIGAYTVTSGGGSVDLTNNTISGISASGATSASVKGISLGGGTSGNTYDLRYNTISNIAYSGSASTGVAVGISLSPFSITVNGYGNAIHDISTGSSASTAFASGIYVGSGTTTFNFYNNFIQRISAPSGTNAISASGLYLNSAFCTYNIYYNTIALGQSGTISGGTNFGCAGIYYPLSTTFLIKNNIIYVNASVSGTGVASCVRRVSGTANVIASNFSTASNGNFYWINPASRNYVYVEGTTTASIVNGWAYSSAITSAANNLNNDPCYNVADAAPESYKAFYGPTRENASYYDLPPFAGGGIYPDNLKLTASSTSYAESHAIDYGSVSQDYEGDIRFGYAGYSGAGTAPDVGADEGEFTFLSPSCYLLPIELLSFTGLNKGEVNELFWDTETEMNSDRFEILKSSNGIDFNTIGTIQAAGNSNHHLEYFFTDDENIAGLNYYKLKMIDKDEQFEFSNTIAINLQRSGLNTYSLYPNPVDDILHVSFSLDSEKEIKFCLSDMLGNIYFITSYSGKKGFQSFEIPVSNLASAAYIISITDIGGNKINTPFIKK